METTRKAILKECYNEGKIDLSTFGFLAMGDFSDETVEEAYQRKYIDLVIAAKLLKTKTVK